LTCSNAPAYLNSGLVCPGFAACESRKLIYFNGARFAIPSVCSPFASRSSFAGGVILPDCGILVLCFQSDGLIARFSKKIPLDDR
jgi:hypothetical protein